MSHSTAVTIESVKDGVIHGRMQRRKPFTPAETEAINAGQCPRCYSKLAAEGQRLICSNVACGKKGGRWYTKQIGVVSRGIS